MTASALVAHEGPDAVIAYAAGRPITVAEFLAQALQVARAFPPGRHILNACLDRYHFAVGLAASMIAGRVSVLPSTHTPEMIRQLQQLAADLFCLADSPLDIDLPTLAYPANGAAPGPWTGVPQIPDDQLIAIVFTSGSTGTPQPHLKHWAPLVHGARAETKRLGLAQGPPCALVGTVPPQHMYGFESTVLLAFLAPAILCAERPFYPADITAALGATPRPRILVTSPVHLRALLSLPGALPHTDLILSATAPLPPAHATEAEQRLGGPLVEIYGTTETGQIATRRLSQTSEWEVFPGIQLRATAEAVEVRGAHVPAPAVLGDQVRLVDATHFVLEGRGTDLINVAGKRTSLAYLNYQLNAIPGVEDGAFFVPDEDPLRAAPRLAAAAVAPGLTLAELDQLLRDRIDPAFFPRPLRIVPSLPRNATGKLPRAALAPLFARAHPHNPGTVAPQTLFFAPEHPVFAGHFPHHPVVPGALLLDAVVRSIRTHYDPDSRCDIEVAKFLSPVAPGEVVQLTHEAAIEGRIRFALTAPGRTIATGSVQVTSGTSS